jgi:hypothetical protein
VLGERCNTDPILPNDGTTWSIVHPFDWNLCRTIRGVIDNNSAHGLIARKERKLNRVAGNGRLSPTVSSTAPNNIRKGTRGFA